MLCPQLKYKVLYRSLLGLLDVIRLRRDITYDCCGRYSQTWRKSFPWSGNVHHGKLPGASVRNSAQGKGHEEGGSAYAKVGSSLRRPPILEHLPPKPESAYFTALCSHLHLWLYRGLSPTSLREGVNLQLQLIKIPGRDKGVSGQTSLLAD